MRRWGRGAAAISHPCAHNGNDEWSRTKKGERVGQRERGDAGALRGNQRVVVVVVGIL